MWGKIQFLEVPIKRCFKRETKRTHERAAGDESKHGFSSIFARAAAYKRIKGRLITVTRPDGQKIFAVLKLRCQRPMNKQHDQPTMSITSFQSNYIKGRLKLNMVIDLRAGVPFGLPEPTEAEMVC